jgi:hypothetical protein
MAYMISIMNLLVCKFISCLKFNHSEPITYQPKITGGGMSNLFTLDELSPYIATELNVSVDTKFKFLSYITNVAATELQNTNSPVLTCSLPLVNLISKLAIADIKVIATCHNISVHSKMKR